MTSRQRSWLLPPAVLALIAGILIGRGTPSPAFALFACLPVLAAILLGKGILRFIGCLFLSLAVGTAAGSLAWHPSLPPEADYDVQGVISDEIRSGHFGQVRIKLTHVTLNGREHSGGAYWTFYLSGDEELPAGLEPGKMVSFRSGLYHPSGSVNPDGYDMDPDSDVLTLTDTFSDTLSIDYNTIKVEPSEGASWYVSGNTATFMIPDETPVVITYKARVIGNGNIHFENTAEVRGQKDTYSDTRHVTSTMGGTSSNFYIKLLKHKRLNFTELLGGATFGLFELDESGNGVPVKDNNGADVTVTTAADGTAVIEGSRDQDGWALIPDKMYYVQELEAPEGYNLSTTKLDEAQVQNAESKVKIEMITTSQEKIKIEINPKKPVTELIKNYFHQQSRSNSLSQ